MIEIIEEKFRGYRDTEETLKRNVLCVVENVKKADDVVEFLNNYALDIRRTQTLVNGKWETLSYEFCLGCGGPNIYLDTEQGIVKGYWGGETFIVRCDDKEFLEKLQEMEEFLNEIYTT